MADVEHHENTRDIIQDLIDNTAGEHRWKFQNAYNELLDPKPIVKWQDLLAQYTHVELLLIRYGPVDAQVRKTLEKYNDILKQKHSALDTWMKKHMPAQILKAVEELLTQLEIQEPETRERLMAAFQKRLQQ